jgi:secreted trypsin-like serine protease
VYLSWQAPFGNWESSAALVDTSYASLTVDTEETLVGRWTLTATSDSALVSGSSFDVYAAAADLLEQWATAEALNFDFSADDGTFNESQKREALMEQAARYRQMSSSGTKVVSLAREDGNWGV